MTEAFFDEENSKYFWSMSGYLIFGHREVYRTKLYIASETSFLHSAKIVDVMRQTKRSIDNASVPTLNDNWNDDQESLVQVAWMGTTRIQILRIKLPEGHALVNGRPTKVQTMKDLARRLAQSIKETKKQEEMAA